ncbi:MAG: hypothetical protein KKI02_05135 [Planctomycetes bacterium]|nr:hypothetical protein [Planctomycetota bacterium]
MTDALPPVPSAAPTLSVAVSVDGRIAEDKICIDCGYNLRGLKTDGRCPECGGEVAASLRGHELNYASLPWLRSVRRGFRLIKRAILLSLLAVVVTIVIEEAWEALHPGTPLPPSVSFLIFGALITLTSLLALYGFALATGAEPRLAYRGEGWSFRRWARVLAVSALALWGGLELLTRLGPKTGWVDQIVMYVPLVLAVLVPLAAAAFVQYVIALLERAAEEKVLKEAKRTRQYVYVAIALAAVVLLTSALAPFFRSATDVAAGLHTAASAARDCGSCVSLLFVLGALQLIWRVSKILDRVVVAAENDARLRAAAGTPPASA